MTLLPPEELVDFRAGALLNTDPDKAIAFLKMNVSNYPQSYAAYANLAKAYAAGGKRGLAMEYFEKSLELNPVNESASEQLEQLRSQATDQ